MLYNRCTGIYKFGNNTYSRRIRRRSNLGHIFREKKYVLWAGIYGIYTHTPFFFKLNLYTIGGGCLYSAWFIKKKSYWKTKR